MLPKKNRVPRKDFPSSKTKGLRGFSPIFSSVLYFAKETEGIESRVSVVVSKKTAKTAVVRNLLRRRFYEAIRPFLGQIKQGVTVVIYPKKEAIVAKFPEIEVEMEKTLKQTKLI